MNSQPRALYLLNCVSMWECFSYYGMRVLLVLYMVQALHYSDTQAFAIYTAYITLLELGGLVGGVIADRFLGLKKSVMIGGWIMALGHLTLAMSASMPTFTLSLALLIIGAALFRTNIVALLGTLYGPDDPRRDSGYTVYYTGINIGSFLASICCGIISEMYGWHTGFGLAAIGMVIGNIVLLASWNKISDETAVAAERQSLSNLIQLAHKEMPGIRRLALFISLAIVFYACEEQLGSTLVLFAERHIDRLTLWGTIPAASLITFNPLTILIVGPLLARVLQRFPYSSHVKAAISFALLGMAFYILWIGCALAEEGIAIPLSYAVISIIFIGLAEIFIGPTLYSVASQATSSALQGITMGFVAVGFSIANLTSGFLSQMMSVIDESSSLEIYASGFNTVGLIALSLSIALIVLDRRQKVVTTC
jgi:POT family proton-dependent oligopeptide transporter